MHPSPLVYLAFQLLNALIVEVVIIGVGETAHETVQAVSGAEALVRPGDTLR